MEEFTINSRDGKCRQQVILMCPFLHLCIDLTKVLFSFQFRLVPADIFDNDHSLVILVTVMA